MSLTELNANPSTYMMAPDNQLPLDTDIYVQIEGKTVFIWDLTQNVTLFIQRQLASISLFDLNPSQII